jgi:Xaa-Pro aminopeptidase
MANFDTRRDQLRRLIAETSLDALLVTDERNVTYLTGFTGDSSYLLVARRSGGSLGELLLTDGRYTEQLESECPGLELAVRSPGVKQAEFAIETLSKLAPPSLGIESDSVSVGMLEKLKSGLKATSLAQTVKHVETLREIKYAGEVAEISEALRNCERAISVISN